MNQSDAGKRTVHTCTTTLAQAMEATPGSIMNVDGYYEGLQHRIDAQTERVARVLRRSEHRLAQQGVFALSLASRRVTASASDAADVLQADSLGGEVSEVSGAGQARLSSAVPPAAPAARVAHRVATARQRRVGDLRTRTARIARQRLQVRAFLPGSARGLGPTMMPVLRGRRLGSRTWRATRASCGARSSCALRSGARSRARRWARDKARR